MRRPVENPPNPWLSAHVDWLGEPPEVELEVFEIQARSILSKNTSPDIPFTFSLNPYQGCYHGCIYCYARPSHQYLQLGAGTDFERKLFVKTNAPELLRETFDRKSWTGEAISISGNTDCYQPLEASYQLTRKCLEVCLEYCNPVRLITKGGVILRDVELLGRMARETDLFVYVSITTLDDDVRRKIEPFAAPIDKRFEILRRLSDAGVPTGVSVSPLIPGLNDSEVPGILERARDSGASEAFMVLLRLAGEVRPVFLERFQAAFPLRYEKVVHALSDMHGGELYDPRFGRRMEGTGKRWAMIEQLFETQCKRLGLNVNREGVSATDARATFARPRKQLSLF
jgi:DNA repair photolyase